jgi:hypothetical protein
VYVIVSLGTATLAQWQAKGLPVGVTPAIGAEFVATATGAIGGSGAVQQPSVSGITSFEGVGDANQMNAINPASPSTQGMYIMVQALSPSGPTAPVDGTVIAMDFYLSNSSVQVDGQ